MNSAGEGEQTPSAQGAQATPPMPSASARPRNDSLAPGLFSGFGFGRRLVDVGVSPDIEEQLALRLRICNGLAAVNVLVCLGIGIDHWFNERGALALSLLLSSMSWLGVFVANRLRLHRVSRISVVALFLGNILIYMGLLGSDSRLEVLCFAASLLACFLFTLDDWAFWILALGLSSLVYGAGESTMRALFGPAPMPGGASPFISVAVTFIELVLVAYFFAFESRRSFRALQRETLELEAARADAQSAANSKSQFLVTMSHELRTPLNGVVGMTQLLSLTRLDPEQREHLRTLAASSEYLVSVLDGVLDLNKLEAGRVDFEITTFQLSAAVESVASLLMDRGRQKGLKLGVQIDDDCTRWVSGDQRRLQQVIFNLVGNAVKFTERGSVSIRVRRTGEGPQAGWSSFEFTVEDTGIGMSDQELQQLFLPFRQANTNIARRCSATGLGLAISYGLTELMGGSLRCASRAGSGSKFVLSLGFEDRPAPEKSSLAARTPPQRREPLGLSVLLAEDNVVNQKVVSAFLKVLGCECEVVADGLQVLDRLRLRPFDVVLMDCQMPELDGVSTTLRIRQSGASYAAIPIVALTANVLDEERARCYAAGMNGYLTKPIARAKLHEELLRHVTRRSGLAAPSFA